MATSILPESHSYRNGENSSQDDLPQPLDPVILAELLSDTLTIVDREDDCMLLCKHSYHTTWLGAGERLTEQLLLGTKRVVALQRPGPEGAAFGMRVKAELGRLRWKGTLTRCSLPDPFFDLAIVERETGPDQFAPFIASLAAIGVDDELGKGGVPLSQRLGRRRLLGRRPHVGPKSSP
jgi:hypothetical protein